MMMDTSGVLSQSYALGTFIGVPIHESLLNKGEGLDTLRGVFEYPYVLHRRLSLVRLPHPVTEGNHRESVLSSIA